VLDPEVVGIWPKGAEKVRRIFSFSHGSGNGWLCLITPLTAVLRVM
jgi:hypothetical protein